MSSAKQPTLGPAACSLGAKPQRRGVRALVGMEAAAESNSVASAALGPAWGPWGLTVCQATLWASRGKTTFSFVREHIPIYLCPRHQGEEQEATIPAARDTAGRAHCAVKKAEGQGSPAVPSLP